MTIKKTFTYFLGKNLYRFLVLNYIYIVNQCQYKKQNL